MSAEPEFVLFDRLSGNFLGEFSTHEEAEEVYLRFVRADA